MQRMNLQTNDLPMENWLLEHSEITFGKHHFPLHLHPQYCTVSFTLSGNASLLGPKNTYQIGEGDIVLIPPHIPHQTIVAEEFNYKIIRLHIDVLGSFPNSIQIISSDANSKLYQELHQLIFENEDQLSSAAWVEFMDKHYYTQITKREELFSNVLLHIRACFQEQLTLHKLSELAYMSPSHFHRRFSQCFSLSPLQYIMSLRIDYAKKAMRNKKNLTEVALESGFYDQSHFNKYFKRYAGLRPKDFLALMES